MYKKMFSYGEGLQVSYPNDGHQVMAAMSGFRSNSEIPLTMRLPNGNIVEGYISGNNGIYDNTGKLLYRYIFEHTGSDWDLVHNRDKYLESPQICVAVSPGGTRLRTLLFELDISSHRLVAIETDQNKIQDILDKDLTDLLSLMVQSAKEDMGIEYTQANIDDIIGIFPKENSERIREFLTDILPE